jgi:hypothetical protein
VLLADLPAQPGQPGGNKTLVLKTTTGEIKRGGDWPIPRRLRVESGMGSVHLDFSETPIPYDQVDIAVQVGVGSVHLVLPDGASADLDGVVVRIGSTKSRVPQRATGTGVHFVVTGGVGTGSVKVSYRRRGLFSK